MSLQWFTLSWEMDTSCLPLSTGFSIAHCCACALLATEPCVLLQIKQKQQEEAALKNAEARAKAEARITSALEQNKQILIKKREDFDAKQAHNEERRK